MTTTHDPYAALLTAARLVLKTGHVCDSERVGDFCKVCHAAEALERAVAAVDEARNTEAALIMASDRQKAKV